MRMKMMTTAAKTKTGIGTRRCGHSQDAEVVDPDRLGIAQDLREAAEDRERSQRRDQGVGSERP